MKTVKLITSIFVICAAYVLLRLIFGKEVNEGSNKYVHKFFMENGDKIALVVFIFLGILSLADAYEWSFNTQSSKHLEKVVLIEGMSGNKHHRRHHNKHHHHKHHHHEHEHKKKKHKEVLEDGFCKYHKGKAHDLEKACNKLSHNNCMKTNCCVKIKKSNGNEKCVAGNKDGPTYRTKNQKIIDIDGYYFKNKYYGVDKSNMEDDDE